MQGPWRLKERKSDSMVRRERPGWGGRGELETDQDPGILVQALSLRLYVTLEEVLASFRDSVSPFVKQG